MTDRCCWKHCQENEIQGFIVGTNKKEYPICWKHWVRLATMQGTTSENVIKFARKKSSR